MVELSHLKFALPAHQSPPCAGAKKEQWMFNTYLLCLSLMVKYLKHNLQTLAFSRNKSSSKPDVLTVSAAILCGFCSWNRGFPLLISSLSA